MNEPLDYGQVRQFFMEVLERPQTLPEDLRPTVLGQLTPDVFFERITAYRLVDGRLVGLRVGAQAGVATKTVLRHYLQRASDTTVHLYQALRARGHPLSDLGLLGRVDNQLTIAIAELSRFELQPAVAQRTTVRALALTEQLAGWMTEALKLPPAATREGVALIQEAQLAEGLSSFLGLVRGNLAREAGFAAFTLLIVGGLLATGVALASYFLTRRLGAKETIP